MLQRTSVSFFSLDPHNNPVDLAAQILGSPVLSSIQGPKTEMPTTVSSGEETWGSVWLVTCYWSQELLNVQERVRTQFCLTPVYIIMLCYPDPKSQDLFLWCGVKGIGGKDKHHSQLGWEDEMGWGCEPYLELCIFSFPCKTGYWYISAREWYY